ncbi:MAG: hypothetical protein WD989_02555 [Candidatus Paceibacterota bacterium]
MDYNIVSSTIASLFSVSETSVFQLAQLADSFPFLKEGLGILKLIMIGLTVIIFLLLVFVTTKLNRLTVKKINIIKSILPPDSATSGVNARWAEVQKHITSTREAEWKFAVIEADKIMDDILKNSYPGETMGERLLNIGKGQLETLDGLWEAHKIRNRLVHDSNYFLRYTEAKKAVILYERTLKELHAL